MAARTHESKKTIEVATVTMACGLSTIYHRKRFKTQLGLLFTPRVFKNSCPHATSRLAANLMMRIHCTAKTNTWKLAKQ